MAEKPLRVIAFAYYEMDEDQYNAQFEQTGKEFEQALDEGLLSFTFLGAFGLKDPLRENVKSVVQAVKYKDNVKVRMISGDHHATAVEVARKAGIITLADLEQEDTVMDSAKFREIVGTIV